MNRIKIEMDRRIFLVFLLLAILFIAGCTGRGPGFFFRRQSAETRQDDTPFTTQAHQGTLGLEMRFAKNNPPREVFFTGSGTPFTVVVELRNRGATRIENGYLYISGYDKNIIQQTILSPSGANYPIQFDIEPVTNFNPEGGYEIVEFENAIINWPPGTDSYRPVFRASACYQYETVANPVVCIDPHPFSSLIEDKPCRVRNKYDFNGQGAPVAITRVEQEGTEEVVHFRIHIQNMQVRGVVYDKDRYDPSYGSEGSCPFNLKYTDINKIYYDNPTPFFSGDSATKPQLIECKPQSPVRLVDNKAVIFCKFALPDTLEEIYQTPLTITLRYGYLNYEEQQVTIKNVADI